MNGQFRIDALYAFVAVDADGTEGLTGFMAPSGWMPMVAADRDRLESLRPIAQRMADASGQSIELVQFTTRTHVARIAPKKGGH